jgi:hypothetical protein
VAPNVYDSGIKYSFILLANTVNINSALEWQVLCYMLGRQQRKHRKIWCHHETSIFVEEKGKRK